MMSSSKAVLVLLACTCAGLMAVACAQLPASERLLVKLRPGATVSELDAVLKSYGARRVDLISRIDVHVVQPASRTDSRNLARTLEREPFVEFAEVDERVPPSTRRSSTTAPR